MSTVFSSALSQLRRENNLSQRQAAAELGISQALLSHYENGLREPRLDFVVKVCDYYGVSADFVLGRTEKRDAGEDVAELVRKIDELKEYTDKVFINTGKRKRT